MSLEEVGKLAGWDLSTQSRLERGETDIKAKHLIALSGIFHCHPVELILDVEDAARDEFEKRVLDLVRGMDKEALAAWLAAGSYLPKAK